MTQISRYKVTVDGVTYQVQVEDETGEIAAVSGGPFKEGEAPARAPVEVRTHLPGNVYAVLCAAGDRVNKGDTLIIVEAMKMESPIYSHVAGTVAAILVKEGDSVSEGQVLIQMN